MSSYILSIGELIHGKIVNRPSKTCKTPYVADVEIIDENKEKKIILAHAPSLGCCGYVDKEQSVYLIPHDNPKTCSHVIHLAHRHEKKYNYLIGVHPKSAEKIVKQCIENSYIRGLENVQELKAEQCFLNSRFDFCGVDEDGNNFVLEVKNVPCGDYEDIFQKERKNRDYSARSYDSKVAYFPDGYRKKKADTISPRALKHIQELQKLKMENKDLRTIIVFVIQRNDCKYFQASVIDPIYKSALNEAHDNGVEVIPIQVSWNYDGSCYYDKVIEFKH